jgi:hypothetical protein
MSAQTIGSSSSRYLENSAMLAAEAALPGESQRAL